MKEMFVFLFTFHFFTAAYSHLDSGKHFSYSHRRCILFMFFFNEIGLRFIFLSRSSSFPVIHVNVDIKI